MSNEINPKKNSIALTEGPSRAAARSYFRSVGFSKEDLHKPIIGIANTWTEIGPCNFHLRQVAEAVKQGVREAGGTPMEFNTITIHDGITMGTQGMKASLISREVIADSIELVTRGNSFDGIVCIAGCDKNMPAAIMALARLDIPGLMLYGGSIAPGKLPQPDGTTKEITILQVFEGMGAHAAGKINDAELEALEIGAIHSVLAKFLLRPFVRAPHSWRSGEPRPDDVEQIRQILLDMRADGAFLNDACNEIVV